MVIDSFAELGEEFVELADEAWVGGGDAEWPVGGFTGVGADEVVEADASGDGIGRRIHGWLRELRRARSSRARAWRLGVGRRDQNRLAPLAGASWRAQVLRMSRAVRAFTGYSS